MRALFIPFSRGTQSDEYDSLIVTGTLVWSKEPEESPEVLVLPQPGLKTRRNHCIRHLHHRLDGLDVVNAYDVTPARMLR